MGQVIYSKELNSRDGMPYYVIEARAEENFLRVLWYDYINEEKAKTGLLLQLEAMEETKRLNLLIDNRKQAGPFPKGIEAWMATEMLPRLSRLGKVKAAHILSENLFTQFSAKKLEQADFINDEENANLKNFESEKEAIKWLNE